MEALRIAIVGPSSKEIRGPIFQEAANRAAGYLGQQIAVEPLRLSRKYHAILVEDGTQGPGGAGSVVMEVMPKLQGRQLDEKLDLVAGCLITTARRAMLSVCVRYQRQRRDERKDT
jgi:hypothetical protein